MLWLGFGIGRLPPPPAQSIVCSIPGSIGRSINQSIDRSIRWLGAARRASFSHCFDRLL